MLLLFSSFTFTIS
jgi:3-oxoacyl-[acyl-carrier protein] reductase